MATVTGMTEGQARKAVPVKARELMEQLNTEYAVPGGPINTVDKTQTIHRIVNPAQWNERAVSMHIYSRPIDSCVVFDLEAQKCFRRDLKYDNE